MKRFWNKYKRWVYASVCVVTCFVVVFCVPASAASLGRTIDFTSSFYGSGGVYIPCRATYTNDRAGAENSFSFDLSTGTNAYGDYSSVSDPDDIVTFYRVGQETRVNVYNPNTFYFGSWNSSLFSKVNLDLPNQSFYSDYSSAKFPNSFYPWWRKNAYLSKSNLFPLETGKQYTISLDFSFLVQSREIPAFEFNFYLVFAREVDPNLPTTGLNSGFVFFAVPMSFSADWSDLPWGPENHFYAFWDFTFNELGWAGCQSPGQTSDIAPFFTGNMYLASVCYSFSGHGVEDVVDGESLDFILSIHDFSISDFRVSNPMAGVTNEGNSIGGDITDQVDVFLDYTDNISASLSAFDFSQLLGLSSITYTFGQMVGDFFDLPYMTLLLYLSVILGSLSMLGGLGVAVSKRFRSRGDTSARVKDKRNK